MGMGCPWSAAASLSKTKPVQAPQRKGLICYVTQPGSDASPSSDLSQAVLTTTPPRGLGEGGFPCVDTKLVGHVIPLWCHVVPSAPHHCKQMPGQKPATKSPVAGMIPTTTHFSIPFFCVVVVHFVFFFVHTPSSTGYPPLNGGIRCLDGGGLAGHALVF